MLTRCHALRGAVAIRQKVTRRAGPVVTWCHNLSRGYPARRLRHNVAKCPGAQRGRCSGCGGSRAAGSGAGGERLQGPRWGGCRPCGGRAGAGGGSGSSSGSSGSGSTREHASEDLRIFLSVYRTRQGGPWGDGRTPQPKLRCKATRARRQLGRVSARFRMFRWKLLEYAAAGLYICVTL